MLCSAQKSRSWSKGRAALKTPQRAHPLLEECDLYRGDELIGTLQNVRGDWI